jgi:hypothetical protein
MKNEKPVKVVKYKPKKGGDGHARETRIFAREIHETFCDDKKCKFYGQHAQQGICHTDKPDLVDWDRIEKIEQEQEEELKYFRKLYKGKEYVKWLEAMYSCAMVNSRFGLDELIRLRRDNALLKLKVKRK